MMNCNFSSELVVTANFFNIKIFIRNYISWLALTIK